jgi:hypothetical protein
MTNEKTVNREDCQEAVEATFTIFANETQGPDFEKALIAFGETYRPAFDNVRHASFSRLMKQCDNLLGSIQTVCGRFHTPEIYFPVLEVYLGAVPLSIKQLKSIMIDIYKGHFEAVEQTQQDRILKKLLGNIIDFKVFERQAMIEQNSVANRFSDQAMFALSEAEKATSEIFYQAAEEDDEWMFEQFHKPLLDHVFSLRGMTAVYNPGALAIFSGEQHFRAGREFQDETSPTKRWFMTHQTEMAQAVLANSWHGKYNMKFAQKIESLGPDFQVLTNALKLRARDMLDWHLVDLVHDHGITPDAECITILKGAYNKEPGTPMDGDFRVLMLYSLIYGDVLGDDWRAPKDENPLSMIQHCVFAAESRNVIDQNALDSIVPRALSLLTREHDIDWIMESELFKPYLRRHRHFQGLRLENGLGL